MRYKYKAVVYNGIKDVYYFYEIPNQNVIFACTNFDESKGHFIPKSNLIQCTGLQDMLGQWIWEGDIVRTSSGKARVVWYKGEFKLQVNNHFIDWDTTEQKVIGNALDEIEE